MSEGFPCFNSWGVKKASCYVSSFLSFSFCIINPMLSMNFKQCVLCFDAVERDGWWWETWSILASSEHNTTTPFGKECLIWGCLWCNSEFCRKKKILVWDMCVQPCSLYLPVRLIRTIPAFSFHLSVRKKTLTWNLTYLVALWCLTLQSHRRALFRPPCSSKQISEPDKSTVLFFPVTNPSSKRRAEPLHQPLVMAMKWTGACAGVTLQ